MNEREGDLRVPLISFLLCLCVIIGGIFLFLYLFVPNLSEPWFPPIALILIGFPWLLWLLTYIYTCIKRCFGVSSNNMDSNRQISRRTSTMANSRMARNASIANGSNNNVDGKQAQFGAASLNSSHASKGADASISSSQEIEMPLTTIMTTNNGVHGSIYQLKLENEDDSNDPIRSFADGNGECK